MALGLTGEDRIEATGGNAQLAASYADASRFFDSMEHAVGAAAMQSPQAFFDHLLATEDTLWPGQNGNWTQGHEDFAVLRAFADNDAFKTELFEAAQDPDFWRSRASIETSIQNAIINSEHVTTGQVLDIAVAQNPALEGIANIIKDDPALAESFRNALQSDPSMAAGFARMAEGNSTFNLDRLETALQNDMQRDIFRQALDRIAADPDDEFNFATLETLAGHIERNDMARAQALLGEMGITTGFDFNVLEFFIQLMTNPEAAMANLTEMLVDSGQLNPEHAGMFMSVGTFAGGLLKGSTVGAVFDVVQDHGGARAVGNQIMADLDADGIERLERNGVLRDGVFGRATNGEVDPEAVSANPRTPDTAAETRVATAPVVAPVAAPV